MGQTSPRPLSVASATFEQFVMTRGALPLHRAWLLPEPHRRQTRSGPVRRRRSDVAA